MSVAEQLEQVMDGLARMYGRTRVREDQIELSRLHMQVGTVLHDLTADEAA